MNIGSRACADAPNDGYTICILPVEPLAYNQFLYKKISFDPDKDFEPITNPFFNTQVLVVASGLNVKSLDELAALSKAKPGTLELHRPVGAAGIVHGQVEAGERRRSRARAVPRRRRGGHQRALGRDPGRLLRPRELDAEHPRRHGAAARGRRRARSPL